MQGISIDLHRGEWMMVNYRLKAQLLEVVDNQLRDSDPKATSKYSIV